MIVRRAPDEVERIDRACRLVREILAELAATVREGVTTAELDRLDEQRARDAGARPAFKGYMGYPASVCISVNEEVAHGLAGERRLQFGDIVSLDVGVVYNGFIGDTARTVAR